MSLIKETGRALMKLGISHWLPIRCPGFRLRFYPTSMSLVLWVNAHRRQASYPDDEAFFQAYLRPGDAVVDVGANVGYYTLMAAARVGPGGRVDAIEAHPRTYRYLCGNVACNRLPNIRTHHRALGDHAGVVRFTDQRRDDLNRVADAGGVEVPLARLDDLDLGTGAIDLLKIDVEGYEKFVLAGAAATLARADCVRMECWDKHFAHFGYEFAEVHDLLSAAGLQVLQRRGETLCGIDRTARWPECASVLAVRDVAALQQRTGWRLATA